MIHLSGLNACKALIEHLITLVPGGILFGIIEDDIVIWRKKSLTFDLDIFDVGFRFESNSSTLKAIQDKVVLQKNISRSVYGKRLSILMIPIVDDGEKPYGGLIVAFPLLHPVAASFPDFAPLLVNVFPSGAFLYMSDLYKIVYRQPSEKFDVPEFAIGYELREGDVALNVIRTKKPTFKEVDASKLGIPVFVANFPLFDDDDRNDLIATLGIIIPKQTAATLREMSTNLESGLTGISPLIQELAAPATEIHTNEQSFHGIRNLILPCYSNLVKFS
jgi:hypothetical protein